MTINLSHVPSETDSPWVWPATAPVLPRGLPLGVLTLIRVRNCWTEFGLRTLSDVFRSVVDSEMHGGLITGNCHVVGPGSGAAAVNVCMDLTRLARSVRLAGVVEIDEYLEAPVLGATVAEGIAEVASTYGRAATVGFWWEDEEPDAEALHTLDALIKVSQVVIEVVGFDDDGPLLAVSCRPSLDEDLPCQRLIPRS